MLLKNVLAPILALCVDVFTDDRVLDQDISAIREGTLHDVHTRLKYLKDALPLLTVEAGASVVLALKWISLEEGRRQAAKIDAISAWDTQMTANWEYLKTRVNVGDWVTLRSDRYHAIPALLRSNEAIPSNGMADLWRSRRFQVMSIDEPTGSQSLLHGGFTLCPGPQLVGSFRRRVTKVFKVQFIVGQLELHAVVDASGTEKALYDNERLRPAPFKSNANVVPFKANVE